jgi:hypothetical protein
MTTPRRRFLQSLSAGAVATGLFQAGVLGAQHPDAPADAGHPELDDDGVAPRQQAWDTTWRRRIAGVHKAVFDIPEIDDGIGVFRAGVWGAQYKEVFQVDDAALSSVLVLRHNGIALAMQQAFWDEYGIGKSAKVKHPMTGKPTTRNPALLTEADGVSAGFAAQALDRQLARGAIALGCGLAFSACVRKVAQRHKLSTAEARERAMAMLVPGVIMQPSGIFAVSVAQESGCVFVRAS